MIYLSEAFFDWLKGLMGIILFIQAVALFMDSRGMSEKNKKNMTERLSRWRSSDYGKWVPDFVNECDSIFGEKLLSWRCFFFSSLISIFTFYVFFSVFLKSFYEKSGFMVIVFAIVINVLADYVSLAETRKMLKINVSVPLKILLDAFFTFIVTLVCFAISMSVSMSISQYLFKAGFSNDYFESIQIFWNIVLDKIDNSSVTFFEAIDMILRVLIDDRDDIGYITARNKFEIKTLLLVMIGTSYITSMWLWLHGLAQLIIKFLSTTFSFLHEVDIKNPYCAIGFVANIILALLSLILFSFYSTV